MQEKSLLSPDFLIMVGYGIISVPLYTATIVIILRQKSLHSSFYKIYVAMGIGNLFTYFNKSWAVRLPLFTCSSCLFANYFTKGNYWCLLPSIFLLWQISFTQYMLCSLIAFDRFIVIVVGPAVVKHWKKVYLYVILAIYILPIIFTKNILWSPAWYEYLNSTDNFRYTTAADLTFLFDSSIATTLSTCGISLFFNLSIFLQFFLGRITVPRYQKSTEIKLFINCLVDMGTQILCASLTYFQKNMRTEDPDIYHLSRVLALYASDIMSLLPPFILIITCVEIRDSIFNAVGMKFMVHSADHSRIYFIASSR